MERLNIGITCCDEQGKALIDSVFEEILFEEICKQTTYSSMGEAAIDEALKDWEDGKTDAIMVVPEEGKPMLNPAGLRGTDMLIWNDLRLAIANDETPMEEQIENMKMTLRREFDIDKPRIAAAFDRDNLLAYDVVLTKEKDAAVAEFMDITGGNGVAYTTGRELVCTSPFSEESFNQCIYLAQDILSARERWDESHANPLPKLFHDKREEYKHPRTPLPSEEVQSI